MEAPPIEVAAFTIGHPRRYKATRIVYNSIVSVLYIVTMIPAVAVSPYVVSKNSLIVHDNIVGIADFYNTPIEFI